MGSMVRAAAFAAAVLACGCQTTKAGPPVRTETGSIAWTDMTGLTQDEIRGRLGLGQTGEHIADTAKLEDGVVVTSSMHRNLLRTPCGTPESNERGQASLSHGLITLNFRDGRMSGYEETGGARTGTGADKPLIAFCTVSRKPTLGQTLSHGQTAGFIIPALVLSPILLAQNAATEAAESKNAAAFAELRLGEAPPGGLEAWLAAHPKLAQVSAADGRTEIKIRSPSMGMDFYRYAYLADGKVKELKGSAPGVCVMRPDRSMICDVPYILR
jgi:hypothetical protein